jgi:hypothetical protein
MNLNLGNGGSFQQAVIIPVPSTVLEENNELLPGYTELVTRYFRGDIFNEDYVNQHQSLRTLLENLRISGEQGLNVNFTSLQAYQQGLNGTLPMDVYTRYFGRFRNVVLVLDFFSTSALNTLTQAFSHTLNFANQDTLMLFSIFTASFMGLWVMTLPLADLFVMPLISFHRHILSIATQLTLDRFRIQQLGDFRSYAERRLEVLDRLWQEGQTHVANLRQDFIADIVRARASSTSESWHQFFQKWKKYIYSLEIMGLLIWFYNHPVGKRIINALLDRLYAWATSTNSPTSLTNEVPLEQVVVEEIVRDHGQEFIDFLFTFF